MQNEDLETVAKRICQKNNFEFVGPVGEGAFKQTFQVLTSSRSPLALKVYKNTSSTGRDQREINAMLRCKHKNIARILSVERFGYKGQRFVVITEEFLPGGTLTSKGQLTVSQCIGIGLQLLEAVAHIASLKLVHRDIKPDNIMFSLDGKTPVITDFGVVRDLNDTSMTPTWANRGPGTPYFSAPEQLNNEKNMIDWRADQFALGIVLGYSVFNQHPYSTTDADPWAVVDSVANRQGPADWFIRRAPEFHLPVLVRMVAPWPIDRFRRPKDLLDAWKQQRG